MKLGMVIRADHKGLASESRDLYLYLRPERAMLVKCEYETIGDWFDDATTTRVNWKPTNAECMDFVRGLDVILCLETPYNWELFNIARASGVKSVMMVNWEFLPDPLPAKPDLFWAKVDWHLPELRNLGVPVESIPIPVDTVRYAFRQRERATRFLAVLGAHRNAGHDRAGVRAIIDAIPLVKSPDARFILHAVDPLPVPDDSRVTLHVGTEKEATGLYAGGDVFLHPRRYAGTSLPMNEALSCGLPVLMTDMDPQNRILPGHWLLTPERMEQIRVSRPIACATVSPSELAGAIDQWVGRDISTDSAVARKIAEAWSWDALGPRIKAMIEGVAPKPIPYYVRDLDTSDDPISIAYCGNFRHTHCTETHVAASLEALGHRVIRLQEDSVRVPAIREACAGADLFLYTRTWGMSAENGRDGTWLMGDLRRSGIPSAALHLDLYLGISRDRTVDPKTDPFWATDVVFSADGGLAHALEFEKRGIRHVHMSPAVYHAECVPGRYRPEYAHDIIFVGTCDGYHGEWSYRKRLLDALKARYGARFVTYGNRGDRPGLRDMALNDLYASATVVVGDSLYSPNYWSDRYFETLGRGGFLVAPVIDGLERFLTPGTHYFPFDHKKGALADFSALFDAIDACLDGDAHRESIRRAGFEHVRAHHTYLHRMASMIEWLRSAGLMRKAAA